MTSKEDTKFRIMKLSEEYFFNKGYKNVKIDEIASELGISKRTFYEIFKSKKDLFHYLIDQSFQSFRIRTNEIIDRMGKNNEFKFIDELKNLWQIIIEYTNNFDENLLNELKLHLPGYWEKCQRFDSERIGDFRKVYQLGIKNGFIKKNISEEVFYLIHFHSLRNLLRPEIKKNLPMTVNEILSNFYEIILTGALTDKAREEYQKKLK